MAHLKKLNYIFSPWKWYIARNNNATIRQIFFLVTKHVSLLKRIEEAYRAFLLFDERGSLLTSIEMVF